jgi:hypothetical protein
MKKFLISFFFLIVLIKGFPHKKIRRSPIIAESKSQETILNPKQTIFIDPSQQSCINTDQVYFQSYHSLDFDTFAKTFYNNPSTQFVSKSIQYIVDDNNNLCNLTSDSNTLNYNEIIHLFVPLLKMIQSVTSFHTRSRFSVLQSNHVTLNQTYVSESRYLNGEVQNFTGVLQAAIYDSYDYHKYEITPNGAYIKEIANTEYGYILNQAQTKLALSYPAGPERDAVFKKIWSSNPQWNLNNDVYLGMSLYD